MRLILIALILALPVSAKVSVVEVPIRIDMNFAKRVAGTYEFFIVFRDPDGKVIAIPEDMLGEMRQTAISEGFDQLDIDDMGYIPTPQQAVGNTAKATVTIERLGDMRFWMNENYSFFVTWDDEHPAPAYLVDGIELTEIYVAGVETPPSAPQPVGVSKNIKVILE